MHCGICPVRSASRSCAIPTCATSSLPLRMREAVVSATSSRPAHQLRGTRRGNGRGARHARQEPAGDVDRCRRRGQNPAGGAGRGRSRRQLRRRSMVCGPGSDHRPRPGTDHRGTRVGTAGSAGTFTAEQPAAVRRRSAHAGDSGQLRAPAGCQRDAHRGAAGRLPPVDGYGDQSRADRSGRRGDLAGAVPIAGRRRRPAVQRPCRPCPARLQHQR